MCMHASCMCARSSYMRACTLCLQPYSSRGSASHIFIWCQTLMVETKALVYAVGIGPFIRLLLEGVASDILVQALTKRWWDTTHTFHIVEREITVTLHDFHRMTGLRSYGPIINLEAELGIQLGIDLLGRAYPNERIRYFDLEKDYKPYSQAIPDDRAQMARCLCCMWWGHISLPMEGAASLATSGLVDPPHLPWSVYNYGADGFAWERFLGRNPNVMGYPFPQGT
ncbi:hypothetical protein SO802_026422 [Lithocarpus litseifolius]|uniref:Aminotransferase-like plant mobile domain-containing protein n=1 Tax=Lithocarpus litseifolius TaxID=425828 RepID=A0AAW2C006_9ROSI